MDNTGADGSRTLWMGDLESWMDESFIQNMINSLGYIKQLICVKTIKDRATGIPLKYCFLQFNNHENAKNFYQTYGNRPIPNSGKLFKLNWAAYGTGGKVTTGKSLPQDIQVYVGDIDISVTEHKLLQFFKEKYPSAYMSKIITDPHSKISKGYGFVKFTNNQEALKSISELNGQLYMGKIIKVSTAYLKTKEEVVQNQQPQSQLLARQKLYTQFYSYMNDPQMKAQYEKQVLKTFGNQEAKKTSLKQRLQAVQSLTYEQTKKSQYLFNVIPRAVALKARDAIQSRIYR